MAVYTEVTDEALRAFLAAYPLGGLLAFRGIAEGVENSNYLVDTTGGKADVPGATLLTRMPRSPSMPARLAEKLAIAALVAA